MIMENQSDIIDELQELKEDIKKSKLFAFIKEITHLKYALTIIGFFILYFFYQLGYIFLYGFYFGGDGQTSIFSIIINPIPFNFKSIVGAGAFWLIYVLLICIPSICIFRKFNGYAFIFFILSSIVGILSLEYMFLGTVNIQLVLPVTILGTPIFLCYMTFTMANLKAYIKSTILCIIYFFELLGIFNVVNKGEIFQYNSIIILLFYLYILVVIPLINKIVSKFKNDVRKTLGKWTSIILFIILIISYTKIINFLFLIYSIIIIYTEIIKGDIIKINKNILNNYKLKKQKDTETKIIKYKKLTNTCVGIISIVFVYPIITNGMILYASYIGDKVLKNYSSNTIKYEFSEEGKSSNEKEGIVVAQQGDTYYISQLPYRKLAIIKSKSIIVD
ncbi:hypothetical protein [Clostridium beijerinckii]|uniref:hypothetical protein n=1 Tax=Clostridium beijerinckii TaxID=1520 RepID=UPI00136133E4|nr:hypothetical protein [Clostridium beijerinckii]MZK50958.1 hypothetical protein [Clostridium beijerinckii]MZK59160.1 hypothetical protein [Clostridium beijerinckii]MZK69279.1 hypothetical protein [Clostridium beijerinckii]MZK74652.1 hypothetical protein [Clostridium beijerinckii]MZK84371.1 hypothetical protein [Clostridium beijerinckii]